MWSVIISGHLFHEKVVSLYFLGSMCLVYLNTQLGEVWERQLYPGALNVCRLCPWTDVAPLDYFIFTFPHPLCWMFIYDACASACYSAIK